MLNNSNPVKRLYFKITVRNPITGEISECAVDSENKVSYHLSRLINDTKGDYSADVLKVSVEQIIKEEYDNF